MVCCNAGARDQSRAACTPKNEAQKLGMTPWTYIAGRPINRPAAKCRVTPVGSGAQRDQWAAGSREGAPGGGCSETVKCGHTASTPAPRPKRLRSSRAARTPQEHLLARVLVHSRVWDRTDCATGGMAGASITPFMPLKPLLNQWCHDQ